MFESEPFEPLVSNPHLLTILANFWPRGFDFSPWPEERRLFRTEPDVQVLVVTQKPRDPIGELVMVHGLEGAGDAGYVKSLAWLALRNRFIAHRFHMRTCGGTENLCQTLYHAGLTSDLLATLRELHSTLPVFLAGFSLGGNVVLKLAGELGDCARDLIAGVAAVSAPIDLASCARTVGRRENGLYERRFLKRMRRRLAATGRYAQAQLARPRSLWDIDDQITAPSFGFGTAANYYATQSSNQLLDRIRIPALLIAAQDDPLIPFETYNHPAFASNPCLTLIAPKHGGHVAFLSRRAPRFWTDEIILSWMKR